MCSETWTRYRCHYCNYQDSTYQRTAQLTCQYYLNGRPTGQCPGHGGPVREYKDKQAICPKESCQQQWRAEQRAREDARRAAEERERPAREAAARQRAREREEEQERQAMIRWRNGFEPDENEEADYQTFKAWLDEQRNQGSGPRRR